MIGPTTNHREIRRWAEQHGAVPTQVPGDGIDDFPTQLKLKMVRAERGQPAERVVSWEDFFRSFDSLGLVFVASDNGSGFSELLQQVEDDTSYIESPYRVLACLAAS